MASREYEQLRQHLSQQCDAADPPDVVREKMHAIHPLEYPDDTIVERLELGGVEAAWVSTPEADTDRWGFLVHGGAFVSTRLPHYLPYARNLSSFTGLRMLVHAYRLAPEDRYPAALDDTLGVYRAAVAAGLDPQRTAFFGDSCGGGIAVAAMCRLRDAGDPLPACFVGLTPWFDSLQEGDAAVNPRGLDPYVNREWIRARFRDYAGDADPKDPSISPLRADLAGLPPLYLGVGQIDTTSDDSTRLAARAAAQGVDVTLDVSAEMIHGFHGLVGLFPEATAAMERVADFTRRRIP
jgi:acetyl esterase/lipase